MIRPLPANLFADVVRRIDSGEKFALVTVVRDSGSTPRKAGTRALADASGAFLGTIGGGPLETQAKRVAMEAMRTGEAGVFDFTFAGPSAAENLPICGGEMRVLVDPTAGRSRQAYAGAAQAQRRRQRGVLITRIEQVSGVRVSVEFRPADAARGGILEATEAARDSTAEVLIEPLEPAPRLVIVGGGHVGQALAQHAALVGFEIVVVEDRPEFADPALLPPGSVVLGGDLTAALSGLETDDQTYVALVSRGHVTDCRALAAVLPKPAAYLGMMGSRRKIALVRQHFVESGLAGESELRRLHAPIGLDIGARTVPEIAASIVAELIAARRLLQTGDPAGPGV